MSEGPARRPRRVLVGVVVAASMLVGAAVLVLMMSSSESTTLETPTLGTSIGLWVAPTELDALPTTGDAWTQLTAIATDRWDDADISDQGNDHDVATLAGALYATRTGDEQVRDRVIEALEDVTGQTADRVLPVARNLVAYVIAADLIGYREPEFVDWLTSMLDAPIPSRAGIDSLRESALRDPSNHGSHARASVVAIARFVDDDRLLAEMAARFHDWLGRTGDGFEWREPWWQADPDEPRGINPPGTEIEGLDVDGVLPEEQRRAGEFSDTPPRENYVWESLQGAIVTAELLHRAGFDAWAWQDDALLRAVTWLHDVNDYPAEGDDEWQPWLVNARYGSDFPATTPAQPGKNMGFTEWTHAGAPGA